MHDGDSLHEQFFPSHTRNTVIMTLAGVVGICGVFAMGYTIGRRVQRLMPCMAAAPAKPARAADGLAGEVRVADDLTFYNALMAEQGPVRPWAPAKPAPSAAVSAAVARLAPKPAPVPEKRSQPKAAGGNFTLQISSVRRREEAQALASAMTRRGLHPYITSASLGGRGTWYRVRVGRYDSLQQAGAARAHLAQADVVAKIMRMD